MYSTGGDLHLELLSGSQEGQKNVWNIPPYHTRPLMKANFVARRENNHTAYVRYGLHVHRLFFSFCCVIILKILMSVSYKKALCVDIVCGNFFVILLCNGNCNNFFIFKLLSCSMYLIYDNGMYIFCSVKSLNVRTQNLV